MLLDVSVLDVRDNVKNEILSFSVFILTTIQNTNMNVELNK